LLFSHIYIYVLYSLASKIGSFISFVLTNFGVSTPEDAELFVNEAELKYCFKLHRQWYHTQYAPFTTEIQFTAVLPCKQTETDFILRYFRTMQSRQLNTVKSSEAINHIDYLTSTME